MDIYGVSISQIEGSIISSVVPALTSGIKRAIKRLTGTVPLCIGPGMKTGLNIKLNDPSTLGADLVAGAVAAIELFDCPASFLISAPPLPSAFWILTPACWAGLSSRPGIALEALTARSAFAFLRQPGGPKNVIGATTADCMRSGFCVRHRLDDGWHVRPD